MSMAAGPCTDMAINVTPLSPALGAEITGVDLRCDLDDATFSAIEDEEIRFGKERCIRLVFFAIKHHDDVSLFYFFL